MISGQISDSLTTLLHQSLMVHCSNNLLRGCASSMQPVCDSSLSSCLGIHRMDNSLRLILTLFFVTLLYGTYLPMYITSMRVLLQPSGDHALKTTALIRRTFLVIATLIFVLETLCVVFELWWCIEYFDFVLFKSRTSESNTNYTYFSLHSEKMRKRNILDIVQVRHLTWDRLS
jgi:hypothetical protein